MSGQEIAQAIEQAPTKFDSTRDLTNVYNELHQLQQTDTPSQYNSTLNDMNAQLVADKVLPDLKITGVNDNGQILMQDIKNGSAFSQPADAVQGFAPEDNHGAQANGADSMPNGLGMLAQSLGIGVTPDGSGYDVASPTDNMGQALSGIFNTMMGGLGLGGSADDSASGDSGTAGDASANNSGADSSPAVPGLNPLLAASIRGFEQDPDNPSSIDDPV